MPIRYPADVAVVLACGLRQLSQRTLTFTVQIFAELSHSLTSASWAHWASSEKCLGRYRQQACPSGTMRHGL